VSLRQGAVPTSPAYRLPPFPRGAANVCRNAAPRFASARFLDIVLVLQGSNDSRYSYGAVAAAEIRLVDSLIDRRFLDLVTISLWVARTSPWFRARCH
jgi:hypothetical protein